MLLKKVSHVLDGPSSELPIHNICIPSLRIYLIFPLDLTSGVFDPGQANSLAYKLSQDDKENRNSDVAWTAPFDCSDSFFYLKFTCGTRAQSYKFTPITGIEGEMRIHK